MKTILFVCHGNICRSTTAQWVFADLVEKAGLEDEFASESAALFSDEIGSPIYPPAAAVLREHHIPYGDHRARKLTIREAQEAYRIYYMDEENLWKLEQMLPHSLLSKVEPLKKDGEITDPWYTRNFEKAFAQIEAACKERLEELTHE